MADDEQNAASELGSAEDEAHAIGFVGAPAIPLATRRLPPGLLASVVAVGVALGWAYGAEFRGLFDTWGRDPNYSHGYLVIPLALLILWRRLKASRIQRVEPWKWGWLCLAVTLAGRAYLHNRGNLGAEIFTLLPVIVCLILTLGGWDLLRATWPAVAYLLFMIPLPGRIDSAVAQPLQKLATMASCALLKASGLWVIAEGNVIHVDGGRLEVANACSGLSMMLTLGATVSAMVLVMSLRPWKQVVLLLSIIPIALASNVLRITATGWCYHRLGPSAGEKLAHDAAGWLMMPLALVLVGLELGILNWLFVDEAVVEEPTILGRRIAKDRTALPSIDAAPADPPLQRAPQSRTDIGPGFDRRREG
jgi:exosortase